jgi:Cu/Ag efflux pump CusA
LIKKGIADSFKPGDHASTFGGNPLATAAGIAALTTILEEGMLENCQKIGDYFISQLEEIKKELPPDLVFKSVDDESEEIQKNLNDFYLLAGLVTGIVFVMIFVVLRRFRPSLLILSSIAFSIVITFNLIYAFKISLNMLTLGALALGFGMFVDNSTSSSTTSSVSGIGAFLRARRPSRVRRKSLSPSWLRR